MIENLWLDLQQTFYLVMGPFIASLLLPIFIGLGLLIATLMSFARLWRPVEKIEVKISREE